MSAPGVSRPLATRRAQKAAGMAAAIEWRERRRCRGLVADPSTPTGLRLCGALAYVPCERRPEGLGR